MAKFIYLYTGGRPPEDADAGRKLVQAWHDYIAGLADHVDSDSGGPLGARQSVGGGPASGAMGYSVILADDLAHAVALTDGHPHLSLGGAVEVIEVQPIPPG
jgi:hypothetical protein